MPLLEGRLVVGIPRPALKAWQITQHVSAVQAAVFLCAVSRADALRMRFQEVARTAGRVIGIAYGAARTGLLRLLPQAEPPAALALIAAVVAAQQPASTARNVDAARTKNVCRMSDVSFLPPARPGGPSQCVRQAPRLGQAPRNSSKE